MPSVFEKWQAPVRDAEFSMRGRVSYSIGNHIGFTDKRTHVLDLYKTYLARNQSGAHQESVLKF